MKEYTIRSFHDELENGKITCEMLVTQYLKRIEEIDKAGPGLNSIIEINPEALETAKMLDKEFEKNKTKIGTLHGVPILIKDNFDTDDEMKTTAGSLSIERHGGGVSQDAYVVKKLRDAGAIILGKTNLSEMANFRGKRSISGWSSRGGQTKNPYVLDRNPSGSSSGSAVAVAANLCIAALGTETDGSITSPSNNNGIVGLKPTIGLVSRSGIIPIAHSQDTAGPMARTVADVAILQSVISGYDKNDEVTKLSNNTDHHDFLIDLDPDGLDRARLGVLRSNFGFHREVDSLMKTTLDLMEELGAILVDPVTLDVPETLGEDEYNTLLYEYHHDLKKYFSERLDSEITSAEDLVEFNRQYKSEVLQIFGQEHLEAAVSTNDMNDDEYQSAQKTYQLFRDDFLATIENNNLDAIIYPTGTPAWLTDNINGDSHYIGSCYQYPAVTGYPHITVPLGFVRGLPVGISFISGPFTEQKLLKFAYAYEVNTNYRIPPKYLETISTLENLSE